MTYRRVLAIALPVVLSNATVPIQGAIDTAIIGNLGKADYLAAVALGAVSISLLLGVFNFLQLGVSGTTAQALGRDDRPRVVNTLARALAIALTIALVLIAFSGWIIPGALTLFEGSAPVEDLAGRYLALRFWGAPAELANYALIGWFAGQEQTRRLFEMQLVISLANIVLNLTLVLGFGLDVEGVAMGTAGANWLGLAYGLWRAAGRQRRLAPGWRPEPLRILRGPELVQLMTLNRDIFLRTLALMGCFAWFARLGSVQGDLILAVNGVLMEFFHIASYGLDGFAMAAETLVGQALGRGDRARLRRAVLVSGLAALGLAALVALLFTLAGPAVVRLFTNIPEVREAAYVYLPWVTLLPLVGVLSFQADGVFIGASAGPAMRNAMLVSAGLFAVLAWAMTHAFGNHGLWGALWLFMLLRAATLGLQYPALERRAEAA